MGKYVPLTDRLRRSPVDLIAMTFSEIAALVDELPASASKHRSWWANSTAANNAHSSGWLAAGWRVNHVDLAAGQVRFVRIRGNSVSRPQSAGRPLKEPAPGLAPTGETTEVTVGFGWQRAGTVTVDSTRRLVFPRLPMQPGVYRMTAEIDDVAVEVYVGETDNLRRRTAINYRKPGASQQTSVRINAWLLRHLGEGARVPLDVVLSAEVTINGTSVPLDLGGKPSRILIENAALVDIRAAGVLAIINL